LGLRPALSDQSVTGEEFTENQKVFVEPNGKTRIGHSYWKGLYREYTDETFSRPKTRVPEWEHLGLLGPVIHASVGDTIVVVFRNKTADNTFRCTPMGSFTPKIPKARPITTTHRMPIRRTIIYLPAGVTGMSGTFRNAPGPGRMTPTPSFGYITPTGWLYHAHGHEPVGHELGIRRPHRGYPPRDDQGRSPKDVDREVINLFTVFDQNASAYLEQNIAEFAPEAYPVDEEFRESNLMHAINGYVYGNLPGLDIKQGETVRWYLIGLGTEVDLHSPHWHGNTVLSGGQCR
jgi:hypothetical protein